MRLMPIDRAPPLQLVAHRGYAAAFPENTEVALAAAVAAGARYIEFDLQLTRDRVPVLLHDATFARTAGLDVAVHDRDLADLAAIDVGEPARFGSRYAGTPVMTLARLAELLSGWPDVRAFVEIKRQSVARFGSDAVVDAVLAALAPVLDQCIIISFVEATLHAARARCAVPVGWAVRHWDDETHAAAVALAPEYLFCNVEKLPADPAAIWTGPWAWVIYEITDPDVAQRLAAQGMTYIETMAIAELQAALAARGAL